MPIAKVFTYEVFGFLGALAAIIAYRLLTREINLSGLLRRKQDSQALSPERLQLLLATLTMSANYLSAVMSAQTTNTLPDVPAPMLAAFGASGLIYAAGKAITDLKIRK